MCFLDIKCFIVVIIFEIVLSLEGLKKANDVFTPYRSFYLRNDRRNNNFDYNFQDWENTTPDEIYYVNNTPLNITENVNHKPKEETITKDTNITYSIQTIPNMENLTTQETGEVTTKQEVTTNTEYTIINITSETVIPTIQEINATYPTSSSVQVLNSSSPDFEETESLHFTLPPAETVQDLLQWLASTSPTEYTTVIPPPPTIKVEDLMPGKTDSILDHGNPLIKPTTNPILEEIKDEINKTNGYFTASIHELLKVVSKKSPNDFKKLLTAMNNRIERLITLDSLAMFSGITVEVFQSVIQMLLLAPDDVRAEYINYAIYAIENRHTAMREDINAVFDVIDNLYIDNDVTNIATVLRKVDAFPKNATDALSLVTETLNAIIFDPYGRIIGTAKERLLLMEINNVLLHRLYPGQKFERRFGKRKANDKFSRIWKSTNQVTNYHQYSKHEVKYKTIDKRRFKHKSLNKNTQPIEVREIENLYTKDTKDKYDAIKIATAVKNYYGDEDTENSIQSHSASSDLSYNSSESSKYDLVYRYNYEDENFNDKYNKNSDKRDLKSHNKALNKNKLESKFEFNKKGTKYKSVTPVSKINRKIFDNSNSIQSADENILKLNLIDALIHSEKIIKRRQFEKKFNKIRDKESFSDDEAVLKSNIYKVFGLNNDFRNQLRTLHILTRTSPA